MNKFYFRLVFEDKKFYVKCSKHLYVETTFLLELTLFLHANVLDPSVFDDLLKIFARFLIN